MKLRWLMALLCVFGLLSGPLALAQKERKPDAAAKKSPMRDPKTGKFMKKTEVVVHGAKKMPARDPKTGRFLKKEPETTGKKKAMPARDPKTGKFIKKQP
jgi:hypothetical protein